MYFPQLLSQTNSRAEWLRERASWPGKTQPFTIQLFTESLKTPDSKTGGQVANQEGPALSRVTEGLNYSRVSRTGAATVLSNSQRQTGGQTTGWAEASRVTPRSRARGRWDQELPSRIQGERPRQEREAAEATGPRDGSPKVSKRSSTGRTQNDEKADLAQREKRECGEDGHTSHRELACPTEPGPSPELSLLHSTPPRPLLPFLAVQRQAGSWFLGQRSDRRPLQSAMEACSSLSSSPSRTAAPAEESRKRTD